MAMSMRRGGDDDNEDDLERLAEEQEERRERNRAWREERERQRRHARGEVSSDEEDSADEIDHGGQNLSAVQSLLACTACSEDFRGEGKIWQCQVGHPVCRKCVDVSWLSGEEDLESLLSSTRSKSNRSVSSLDRFSAISDNSVKEMIEHMTEAELLDLLDRSSDTCSTVTFSGPTLSERQIQEIDWFLNTIDMKRDAIKPYADYHDPEDMARAQMEAEEEERRLAELESSDDETVCEDDKWETIPKDELEMLHSEAMKAKLQAENASEDSGNDTLSESTIGAQFSAPKPDINPIDWFHGTIEIKKDVIQPYSDYNAEEEGMKMVKISDQVKVFGEGEDDELDSASVLGRINRRSKFCKSCEAPIIGRNMFLENLAIAAFQN